MITRQRRVRLADFRQHRDAVDLRQHQIEQHQPDIRLPGGAQAGLPVGRFHRQVPAGPQHVADSPANGRLVLNDHYGALL
jgi:hypothetical protein